MKQRPQVFIKHWAQSILEVGGIQKITHQRKKRFQELLIPITFEQHCNLLQQRNYFYNNLLKIIIKYNFSSYHACFNSFLAIWLFQNFGGPPEYTLGCTLRTEMTMFSIWDRQFGLAED